MMNGLWFAVAVDFQLMAPAFLLSRFLPLDEEQTVSLFVCSADLWFRWDVLRYMRMYSLERTILIPNCILSSLLSGLRLGGVGVCVCVCVCVFGLVSFPLGASPCCCCCCCL